VKENWTLNGKWISPNPKQLPSIIIEQISDLPYWSKEGLEELHLGLLQLATEMAEAIKAGEKKRRELTSFICRTERKIKIMKVKRPATQSTALQRIYDLLLSCEGHSLLPGFGMANRFGDSLSRDPERLSIRE